MRRGTPRWLAAAAATTLLLGACSAGTGQDTQSAARADSPTPAATEPAEPVTTSEEDWEPVAAALGREGTLSDGTVYRVGFPRRDLGVTSRGVEIDPGLSFGSWAAFVRHDDGRTTAMGDLVVTEEQLPAVTDALQGAGIAQTAIHKHLPAHSPPVWWTHFHAEGDDAAQLAEGIRAALDATGTPPGSEPSPSEKIDLDTAAIDEAMGTQGTNSGGIYKFSFVRSERVAHGGKVLPSAMGVATAIGFQPTGGGEAAVNGDFVMTADEVQEVVRALREGGIEVVAVHNHTLDDHPRLFYLHFWAQDDAVELARTLKAAVEQTSVVPAG